MILQALPTNTANVIVGDSSVVNTLGSENGITLSPSQTLIVDCRDASILYIMPDNSGEGITYLLLKG